MIVLIDGHYKIDINYYVEKLNIDNFSDFYKEEIKICKIPPESRSFNGNILVETEKIEEPDIIIYLYIDENMLETEEEKEYNLLLDIIYDDTVCPFRLYKINSNDDIHIIYTIICEILNTNIISSNVVPQNPYI